MSSRSLSAGAVIRFAMFLCGLAPLSGAGTVTYDLNADWSDALNPHGTWAYNMAPGTPVPSHIADWDPTRTLFQTAQPVWSNATWPNVGHIPLFAKIVALPQNPADDWPLGKILVHNNDPFNSPPGFGGATAEIAWTAPAAGQVVITGDLWEGQRYLGRSETWDLAINGVAVSGGLLTPASGTSAAPLSLSAGSGGAGALMQNVSAGDVIALQFLAGAPGTTMGVDFTINLTTPDVVAPVPATWAAGALLFVGMAAIRVVTRRRVI
jgi:hypothetical protein